MNTSNIIIIVLVIVVAVMGYMLLVQFPAQAEAECTTACTNKINNEVIPQLSAAAEQQCTLTLQQTLAPLMQVPACAMLLQQ